MERLQRILICASFRCDIEILNTCFCTFLLPQSKKGCCFTQSCHAEKCMNVKCKKAIIFICLWEATSLPECTNVRGICKSAFAKSRWDCGISWFSRMMFRKMSKWAPKHHPTIVGGSCIINDPESPKKPPQLFTGQVSVDWRHLYFLFLHLFLFKALLGRFQYRDPSPNLWILSGYFVPAFAPHVQSTLQPNSLKQAVHSYFNFCKKNM